MRLTVSDWLAVLQIASILFGGSFVAWQIGRWSRQSEISSKQQGRDIADLKLEIKKLADIITALAVANERMNMMQKQIDEMRHGIGFISSAPPG